MSQIAITRLKFQISVIFSDLQSYTTAEIDMMLRLTFDELHKYDPHNSLHSIATST